MDNYIETEYISDEIAKCEDISEFKEKILPVLQTQQLAWAKKIVEIIETKNLTKTKLAQECKVSRVSVDKWSKGSIPKARETFLRIGLSADYSIDEMNRLLQRYGRYPALYSKSLEDCICIYAIRNVEPGRRIEFYDMLLEQMKAKIGSSKETEGFHETVYLNQKLFNITGEDQLQAFIEENAGVFASAYNRLYSYIIAFIEANYLGAGLNIYNLAESQNWSSSLRQCVSAINQKKWYPTRNKIISLGLHLNMDRGQVDEMLQCAHMEPLCAKNIFESVVIFILEYADINGMMDGDTSEDIDMVLHLAREVMKEFDIPEIEEFITELPDEDKE